MLYIHHTTEWLWFNCDCVVEVVVEYEYEAKEDDELTMNVGDVITNVAKICDGWSEGTLNGKRGMFPDNFVKVWIIT